MSRGQTPRWPAYFPRMKYRGAKRYAGTVEGYVRRGGSAWSAVSMFGDLLADVSLPAPGEPFDLDRFDAKMSALGFQVPGPA